MSFYVSLKACKGQGENRLARLLTKDTIRGLGGPTVLESLNALAPLNATPMTTLALAYRSRRQPHDHYSCLVPSITVDEVGSHSTILQRQVMIQSFIEWTPTAASEKQPWRNVWDLRLATRKAGRLDDNAMMSVRACYFVRKITRFDITSLGFVEVKPRRPTSLAGSPSLIVLASRSG